MPLRIWVLAGPNKFQNKSITLLVVREGGVNVLTVSEYGLVYGSKAVKVPIFGGFPVENPTKKANRLKALLRGMSLSEYGSRGFEYG